MLCRTICKYLGTQLIDSFINISSLLSVSYSNGRHITSVTRSTYNFKFDVNLLWAV